MCVREIANVLRSKMVCSLGPVRKKNNFYVWPQMTKEKTIFLICCLKKKNKQTYLYTYKQTICAIYSNRYDDVSM